MSRISDSIPSQAFASLSMIEDWNGVFQIAKAIVCLSDYSLQQSHYDAICDSLFEVEGRWSRSHGLSKGDTAGFSSYFRAGSPSPRLARIQSPPAAAIVSCIATV